MTTRDILDEAKRLASQPSRDFFYITEVRPGGVLASFAVRVAAARAAEKAGYYRARTAKGRVKALDAAIRSLDEGR